MDKLIQILEDVGLSEKEVKVYLTLLKLGEETASRISSIAELNRITTYTLLKSLQGKGFCSIFERNKVQYFKPIEPRNILSLIEERKEKVSSVITELESYQNKITEKSKVSLFEGKKGITSMLDLLLNDVGKIKEIYAYGNFSVSEKMMEYQSLHWRKQRIVKKIKIKSVVDSINKELTEEKQWQNLSEVKLNKTLESLNSYTLITENYVAYLIFSGELSGVLIRNSEIARKEKFNFDLLWNKG